jgi:hypothetical protein
MASGKLSPRQKMINLMYLIFIAMLALNMSKGCGQICRSLPGCSENQATFSGVLRLPGKPEESYGR